jgi:uncharacterized RDD family membrane protein YckC
VQKADPFLRVSARLLDLAVALAPAFYLPSPMGVWLGAIYLALSDGMFSGRSIGKWILHLKVVDRETGEECRYTHSIRRNLYYALIFLLIFSPIGGTIIALILLLFALPVDLYGIFFREDGMRMGDLWGETMVVYSPPARVEESPPA